MQIPGITIKIGAGAAVVLSAAGAAVFAWMNGDTTKLDTLLANASSAVNLVPVAAWLLAPLALTLIAATLTRFGVLQKLFGDLYKQLTDSHNQTGKRLKARDEQRLHDMLQRWKSPMPYLKRADGWLALWSGRARWSLAGLDRCWVVALIYPIGALLLVWVTTNNGSLGAAKVLPAIDDAWRRWGVVIAAVASAAIGYWGARLSRQTDILRRTVSRLGRFGKPLMRLSDSTLGLVYYFFAAFVAGITAVSVSVAADGVGAAGTGALTGAIAGVIAGAIAIAVAVAVAIAVAVAGAVALAIAVALAGADAIAVAVGGAAAFLSVVIVVDERIRACFTWRALHSGFPVCGIVAYYALLFAAVILLLPQLGQWGVTLHEGALSAGGSSFILLTFVAAFPLLNAIADWASLNATRAFITRMQTGATRGVVARLYLWDIAVALLLTAFVYAAILAVLLLMQRAGWAVDVKSILTELRDNPWSGQSTWLLTLAVTNFIPTLVHMVLWLSDGLQSRDAETREDIEQFLRSGGKDASLEIAPTIIYVLRIQKWLERAMVFSLALALIPLFAICVPWAAGQMLRFV
jgi:hypothetical protein